MASDRVHDEVIELAGELCNGELNEGRRRRLEELLVEDPSARVLYRRYINLHASLKQYHLACQSPGISHKKESPVLGFLGDCFQQGASFFFKSSVFTLLVSLGVPGLVLSVALVVFIQQGAPESPVATIAQTHETLGGVGDGCVPLFAGSKLSKGDWIALQSGLVEIKFDDGAKVILEGPSTFKIQSSGKGFLEVGRLVAKVPKGAEGFAIETPSATIVDLGTEFGVFVNEEGTVEGHVFKGKIEVAPCKTAGAPAPAALCLKAGQAARISSMSKGNSPRIAKIAAAPKLFVRHSTPLPVPKRKSKILFAHHGSADPTTEGWKLRLIRGSKHKILDPKTNFFESAAVRDHGIDAWMFGNDVKDREVQYAVVDRNQISDEILKQANANGWVIRARIKVEDAGAKGSHGGCFFMYRNGETLAWPMFVSISQTGQYLTLYGESSLGSKKGRYKIPNSLDRFVDYEIRYNPVTETADVFVDGRRVATDFKSVEKDAGRGLRLGLQRYKSRAKIALFEWEVLDGPMSQEQSRGN